MARRPRLSCQSLTRLRLAQSGWEFSSSSTASLHLASTLVPGFTMIPVFSLNTSKGSLSGVLGPVTEPESLSLEGSVFTVTLSTSEGSGLITAGGELFLLFVSPLTLLFLEDTSVVFSDFSVDALSSGLAGNTFHSSSTRFRGFLLGETFKLSLLWSFIVFLGLSAKLERRSLTILTKGR